MKNKRIERVGIEKINYQGCLMKCIEYNKINDIMVEFQDEYKGIVHTQWGHFNDGSVKNPYFPDVIGIGKVGTKYSTHTKEYVAWRHMLERCYSEECKNKQPTYKDTTCCDEWLLYENFYEWLHSQENFDKWLNGERWAIDKDILIKGNKFYSSKTCCLVPPNVNSLFTKRDCDRGDLPIGVIKHQKKYRANFTKCGKHISLQVRDTIEEAFEDYKKTKENIIKQMAQEEYDKENITKQCYNAMMNYQVEITD